MKRPAFQFYPGDWQRNANLRRCSPAARGVWVDVMCLLHDSDEYGILRWPLKEIAQAAGASTAHVRELVEKAVLKGADKRLAEAFVYTPRSGRRDGEPVTLIPTQAGPIWYSSRMVKDEYVRTIRGESTRFGEGKDETPKTAPKPPIGDGSSSASASATSVEEDKRGKPAPPPRSKNKTPMPEGFAVSERVQTWAKANGFGKLDQHLDAFRLKVEAKGYTYANWDSAFMEAIREDWAKLRGRTADGAAPPADGGEGEWHETRPGVERRAAELGLGPWVQTEQFGVYRDRVIAEHQRRAH